MLPPVGGEGHVRVGWAAVTGELQGPVGYDRWSFGFRDLSGARVHQSKRCDDYGAAFSPGDVVGCAIFLAPQQIVGGLSTGLGLGGPAGLGGLGGDADGAGAATAPSPGTAVLAPSAPAASAEADALAAAAVAGGCPPELARLPAVSHVRFYVNGVDQGVAYSGIPYRAYYPAASCYGGGRVRANFGPAWLAPPPGTAAPPPPPPPPAQISASGPGRTGGALGGGAGLPIGGFGGAAVAAAKAAAAAAAPYCGVGAMRALGELKPMQKEAAAALAESVSLFPPWASAASPRAGWCCFGVTPPPPPSLIRYGSGGKV